MRKVLFFAMALVASVLAFTSCEPNEPTEVKSVKDIIGTKWRVDSCFIEGNPVGMDLVFEIKSETEFFDMNDSESCSMSIENHVVTADLTRMQVVAKVEKATSEFIHLVGTNEPMHIYISRIPEPNNETRELTKENIVGTWKGDYYEEWGIYTSGEHWYRVLSSIGYHGTDIFIFHEDGTLDYINAIEQAYDPENYQPTKEKWEIIDGKLAFGYPDPEIQGWKSWQIGTVEVLTTNVLQVRRHDSEATFGTQDYVDHFHKIK